MTDPLVSRNGAVAPLAVAVVVASRGRPQELKQLYHGLRAQTLLPAQIILSVTSQADLPDEASAWEVDTILGSAGSCVQRNRGLDRVRSGVDLIAFFDDDYLPRRDTVEGCARLFFENPALVGANGRLAADGINGPGLSLHEAERLLDESWTADGARDHLVPAEALYGCNMVFRAGAVGELRFDERLPLNGWQEDIDFSARVGHSGVLAKSHAFVGVHRGVKGARVSGRKFGFSQIVNPAYLARKGTMRLAYAFKITSRNVLANIAKSFSPEPWIDRRGRVMGNMLGLISLLRGRPDPERILDV